MKRLLLDERPAQAEAAGAPAHTPTPPASETEAQGSEPTAREAGLPPAVASGARRGRRGRRSRARGNSLGIVIEEIAEDDLSGDHDQRALYATLQAAAKELAKKWALQADADDGDGPREFLALVTVTDKAKKEAMDHAPAGAESVSPNVEDPRAAPDLVALLAVRDASDEEPMESDASESESQENGDQDREGVGNPEFVAIVAYTDPSDPSAREEMLKIASVIESLGWSDKKDTEDVLPEVLSVMSKDTSGTRVTVEEAGRQVDAMVLRKAKDDGNLLECISTLAEPETAPKGKKAPRGLLGGWGDDEEDEGGLLELVALLAAQDTSEAMKDGKGEAWEGGKFKYAKGSLREVLALLAARENRESEEESEGASDGGSDEASEDTESEESELEDPASRKPRAKRARTASKVLGQAGASSGPRKTRRGGRGRGGRGVTPEKKAKDEAAGDKKKKRRAGAGARAKAGDARGQPPTGSKSARGKKARRGRRLPPKCR
ncbi:PNMA-like protein 2 [Pteropus alecto]|uniref:PNMA-like protein 2 n=1 Tax=Pteropus alecto TaxID=9402 RepID=L5KQ41_PTEAL|nr:PNMA-like protein 2 [Pteropus alecto]